MPSCACVHASKSSCVQMTIQLLNQQLQNGSKSRKRSILKNTTYLLILVLLLLVLKHSAYALPSTNEECHVCRVNKIRPHFSPDPLRINPRYQLFEAPDILLKNTTLVDGDGKVYRYRDIFISQGTIVEVTENYTGALPDKVVDVEGRYVTPGLVDMHSHFGTRVQPQLHATEDTNEYVSPVTPYVRSIDGIDPLDPEMASLNAAGVTTHLVLTGSKNVISGESYAIKLHKAPKNVVEELLVQYNVTVDPLENKLVRWFKMAYGENEKHTGLKGYPVSRMGEIWKIRESFHKADQLMKRQDKWCAASSWYKSRHQYPQDFEIDSLVSILRGDFNLNIHLYEAYDFESLIRVSKEFGFHIDSFHHALSSYKITDTLKDYNTTIAIFSDEWGGKKEQYDGSVYACKILEDSKIPVAIKTDHPALPGQQLLYYAQIAYNYGLSAENTIAAITSVPAKSIGLGHRLGYLRNGYDADLVVWNKNPLLLGSHPEEVIIDGDPLFKFDHLPSTTRYVDQDVKPRQRIQYHPDQCNSIKDTSNLIIVGIKVSLLDDSLSLSNDQDLIAVLEDGNLVCVGSQEQCLTTKRLNYKRITLNDGYLLPGVTTIAEGMGLREFELEESTSDGVSSNNQLIFAADGLKLDGLLLERMRLLGISEGITAPLGHSFIKGISALFKLSSPTITDSIISPNVAIHFNVGNNAKSQEFPTISSQLQFIRGFVSERDADLSDLPIAIHTHNRGVIEQIIRLKYDFPSIEFIIIGAQEAYLVADEIAKADIKLILSPWKCEAKFWENRHCSSVRPLQRPSVDILHNAGVKFGIASEVAANARRLFLEAGSVLEAMESDFSLKQTSDLITNNIEEIFNIPKNKNYLIFEHNPFELGASVALDIQDGIVKRCFPDVEEEQRGDLLF